MNKYTIRKNLIKEAEFLGSPAAERLSDSRRLSDLIKLVQQVSVLLSEEESSTFIVTDSCMWEKNKQDGTRAPHAIQVTDEKTGQTRYILTGSRIKFIEGDISQVFSQEQYNDQMADHEVKK